MTRDDEFRLRHLSDIQAVIARLSQSSFAIRGWSVTLVSVVFAIFVAADADHRMIFTALVPTAIFWVLDAYYLRQERMFRGLHVAAARRLVEGASADLPDVAAFDMSTNIYESATPSLVRTLFVPHVLAIPALLMLLIIGYGAVAP